ncbi:protein-histidine pros-kinase [Arboricoccus pini]|uniref:histidine kinase n=1 Tax=Arboricoccus pini TaxID=1963835 RepID=A0A212RQH1_9PROT|nr:DUF3365 domain-containing protein [Arboricoccus pini]SNB74712.1 protein-histidine pros-kinase [Arboricoccus pini]
MRLIVKINLVITLAFALALAVSAQLMWNRFVDGARDEVLQSARIMLAASNGMMHFIDREVSPLPRLLGADHVFAKAAVPFFATASVFKELQKDYPDYSVHNVALNPTNPDDRPDEAGQGIIAQFRADKELDELVTRLGQGSTASLKLSRPIVVGKDCLACHDTPARAPPSMVSLYGDKGGFGWKAGETVGAEIVTVPVAPTLERAGVAYRSLLITFGSVFLVVLILLNIFLFLLVIRPIKRMARIADDVSLGRSDIPIYEHNSSDEIGTLARAFNRMRRSLESALKMIEA